MIQYAETPIFYAVASEYWMPSEPVIGLVEGETRWRA